jgi:hypothetical protein
VTPLADTAGCKTVVVQAQKSDNSQNCQSVCRTNTGTLREHRRNPRRAPPRDVMPRDRAAHGADARKARKASRLRIVAPQRCIPIPVCAVLRNYQRHATHDSSSVLAIMHIADAQRATAGRFVDFASVSGGCSAVARHNVAGRAAAGVAAVLPQGADVCVTSTLTVLDVFAFLRPENNHATSCSAAHDTRGNP